MAAALRRERAGQQLSPDAAVRQKNIDHTIHTIELAYALGIPTIRVNTGRWGTSKDFDELMANRGIEPRLPGHTDDDAGFAQFLLSRTASFSHLRLNNHSKGQKFVTDSVEETVDRLNQKLDADDEDRVAILTAPHKLAGFAVMRYAAERVMQSARDNITELRERGFLP